MSLKKIINWLKTPFFFINSFKFNFLISIGVGFFIFLFLYIFKPFGIHTALNNLLSYAAGFGLVAFTCTFIYLVLLPFLFKNFFNNEKWTIGKNLIFFFFLVLTVSFGNYFYNSSVQISDDSEILSLKTILINTFSLAIFPIVISTYIVEWNCKTKRKRTSEKIMNLKNSKKKTKKKDTLEKEVQIFADNNKENIIFNLNNLIYITSNGNYVSFYLLTENGVKENLLRATLTGVLENLGAYSNIIRCHKSYIINSKFMKSIYGNARGYYLESEYIQTPIPVSRTFKKEELNKLIS